MEYTQLLLLDSTGNPFLVQNEVLYRLQEGVDVYEDDSLTERQGGTIGITSHRIYWLPPAGIVQNAFQFNISQVVHHSIDTGWFNRSKRLVLHLSKDQELGENATKPQHFPIKCLKLKFRKKGTRVALENIIRSIERKAWEKDTSALHRGGVASHIDQSSFAETLYRKPGLAGVLEMRKQTLETSRAFAETAFSDLNELAKYAADIVAMSESISAELAENRNKDEDGPDGDYQIDGILADMGAVSAVTKGIAGKAYLPELARQISGFIKPRLEANGGTMTLTDVYCLYNRARGSDLISPSELLNALELLPSLDIPMHISVMGNGLKVLSLNSLSCAAIQEKVVRLLLVDEAQKSKQLSIDCPPTTSISDLSLCKEFRLPLPIATTFLLEYEKNGLLCRDDTIAGLRYYLNPFV